MAAPGGPEVAAAAAAPGRRQPFGSRFLTDPSRLFQHNAWDNVEWSEEQEASARNKVQENSRQLVPQDKQDEYELNANEYWNDFYKIHENGFFKDRHWLFTEFPELAPNQNLSQPEASEYKDGSTRKPRDTRLGSCENGLCSLETRTQEHHHLDLMKDSNNIINRLDTDGEAVLKLGDLKLSDGDFPGSSATYRILEVGCGAGNTVFPILQTNNDPGLFVYCCDFSNTAVDLVQTNAEYDSSRCFAFVHDLCKDQSPYPMPEESLDIIILIFVLSALLPENVLITLCQWELQLAGPADAAGHLCRTMESTWRSCVKSRDHFLSCDAILQRLSDKQSYSLQVRVYRRNPVYWDSC
ncbi:tRNA N(3)-methylcytidine methyltransferase METTL2A isoform X2 [Mauremys reevesii]|uniref:tRNA N(3)-methylcytidine methyltransferase METTL2A isoform X2 n=1 Tax=Mauremys reevesii TaxID=260615 RepID=UPI00193EF91E|nr:tRNA N(3)-methylcytidine methyltransferase METTL2A isoform X2 [Mauremys reevesii]